MLLMNALVVAFTLGATYGFVRFVFWLYGPRTGWLGLGAAALAAVTLALYWKFVVDEDRKLLEDVAKRIGKR